MPLFDWIQMNLNSTRLRRMKYPLSTHLSTWLTGQLLPLVPVWVASNMSVSYVPRLMLLLLLFILAYGAWDVSKDSLGWLLTGYSWFEFMFMGWEGVGGGLRIVARIIWGCFGIFGLLSGFGILLGRFQDLWQSHPSLGTLWDHVDI